MISKYTNWNTCSYWYIQCWEEILLLKKKTRIIQTKTLDKMVVRMRLERVGGGPIANADIIMYTIGSKTPFIRKTDENGCFSKKKN